MNPASDAQSPNHSSGPRQLAPTFLGKRYQSRHTAMRMGALRAEHIVAEFKNVRFWVIAASMTAVFLAGFWAIKDIPALPWVDLASFRNKHHWSMVFSVSERAPVVENGKVVEPGEKYYTVPSAVLQRDQPEQPPVTP